jgi:hypothetical protein
MRLAGEQRSDIFHVIVHGPPRIETSVAGIQILLHDFLLEHQTEPVW